jgi:phospholipid transport system substrate-binding protein
MGERRIGVGSLMLVCAVVMGVLLSTPAAANPDGARDFIRSLGDQTVATLSDHSLSKEVRTDRLRRLFARGFDTRTIALFALGRHWRGASQQQLREYFALFEEFIVTSYAERFGAYTGETLAIKGARVAGGGDVVVLSELEQPGEPGLRVDWRVRQTKRGYKIIDVIVEGVSMLITQRDEFIAVIRSHGKGIEGLLAALRKKTGTPGVAPPSSQTTPEDADSNARIPAKRVGMTPPPPSEGKITP